MDGMEKYKKLSELNWSHYNIYYEMRAKKNKIIIIELVITFIVTDCAKSTEENQRNLKKTVKENQEKDKR